MGKTSVMVDKRVVIGFILLVYVLFTYYFGVLFFRLWKIRDVAISSALLLVSLQYLFYKALGIFGREISGKPAKIIFWTSSLIFLLMVAWLLSMMLIVIWVLVGLFISPESGTL